MGVKQRTTEEGDSGYDQEEGETVRMRSKRSFRNRVWRVEEENENIPSEKSSFRPLSPQ